MKINSPLSNDDFIFLLKEQRYDEILVNCQEFIRKKVDTYLNKFHYYKQFNEDFFHEVCIHILTKSLPSPGFLKACEEGSTFKFYLAKSIRNLLNTLLSREKNKKQYIVDLENLYSSQGEDFDSDKSTFFMDRSFKGFTDSQDILDSIHQKFDRFIANFHQAFPKIAHKLILLLKLQARITVHLEDIQGCFPDIRKKDIKKLQHELGNDEDYRHKEDKELFTLIYPYFQSYRKEKGSPSALQRWINQHISGDKNTKGILDYLEIRESEMSYRIHDKKLFADFLHIYFRNKEEEAFKSQPQTEHVPEWNTYQTQAWLTAFSSR